MILLILSGTATGLALVSLILGQRWLRAMVAFVLWISIIYVLVFYTGSVARSVLAPGPPVGLGDNSFYEGIQRMGVALKKPYYYVIYVSFLNLLLAIYPRRSS
jgi:hypothetical protein